LQVLGEERRTDRDHEQAGAVGRAPDARDHPTHEEQRATRRAQGRVHHRTGTVGGLQHHGDHAEERTDPGERVHPVGSPRPAGDGTGRDAVGT
jgi:hypothetical protein